MMKIKLIVVVLTAYLFVSCATAQPGPARAQIGPTPTPLPALVMTATAAADRVSQAQQAKANAAQLEAQAEAARRQADAEFNAAQQAANDARSALLAQQFQAAGEHIGRAEANIATGRAQIEQLSGAIGQMRITIDGQAENITGMTNELQMCRTEKKTILDSYTYQADRLSKLEGKLSIDPIIAVFFFVAFMAIVLGFIVMKWQTISIQRISDPKIDVLDSDYDEVHEDDPTLPQE